MRGRISYDSRLAKCAKWGEKCGDWQQHLHSTWTAELLITVTLVILVSDDGDV